MQKEEFALDEDAGGYLAQKDGIELVIDQDGLSEAALALAAGIFSAYDQRAIAAYLAADEGVKAFFGDPSPREVADKLGPPFIRLYGNGGMISYLEHQLDETHIIDVEFSGPLKALGAVSIDG